MRRYIGVCMVLLASWCQAGITVDQIRSRGELRCGVSEGVTGFSEQDAQGRWQGMDVDFCRALAAAVLGDANKVAFLSSRASERFPLLLSGKVDVLARNTSWTLTREALLQVRFPATLYFDSQGFMVPAASAAQSLKDLQGSTICVQKGSTQALRLPDVLANHEVKAPIKVLDSAQAAADAFFAGQCAAYSSDVSQLAGVRLKAPGGQDGYRILPDRVSKEALGPVVRQDDPAWETLVRWTMHLLVLAEEHGVTAANVGTIAAQGHGAGLRMLNQTDDRVARALGVEAAWALNLIRVTGNYGEMFDRNLGAGSALKLDRGLNRLWTEGGLMYAPPVE